MSKLYDTHVPLTRLSKLLLAGGSGLSAITNPARGDMVAAMGEATAIRPVLENIRKRMEMDDAGRSLLQKKCRIRNYSVSIDRLHSLPEGSFGRQYAKFLDDLNTSPNERPDVQFIDDVDLLYVMQRYRETHDFNHIVLQMPTNMLGEVIVKYFEAIQLGLPMAVLGSLFGGLRLLPNNRRTLVDRYLPWIEDQAMNARLFIAVDWENHWKTPLRDLQRSLNVVPVSEFKAMP